MTIRVALSALAVIGLVATSSTALAANASLSLTVNASVEPTVLISGASSGTATINLGTWAGPQTAQLTGSVSVNVWSNSNPGRLYTVTAASDPFLLEGGTGNQLAYTLTFAGKPLSPGGTTPSITGCNKFDCSAGGDVKAQITATVAATEFEKALSGSFTDTVVLTLAPI